MTNATYIASCSNFMRSIEMLKHQITSATNWSNFSFAYVSICNKYTINYVSKSWCRLYSIPIVQYATELRIYTVTDFFFPSLFISFSVLFFLSLPLVNCESDIILIIVIPMRIIAASLLLIHVEKINLK